MMKTTKQAPSFLRRGRAARLSALLAAVCLLLSLCAVPALAADSGAVSARVVRVGMIDLKGYATRDALGNCSGVNAEYAYKIAQYADLQIQIVLVQSAKDALTMLDDGRIDAMCNVIQTPDRMEKYLFSEHAVGSIPMSVFTRKSDTRYAYDSVDQLKDMRFAVEENSKVKDTFLGWCAQHGFQPTLEVCADFSAVKRRVDSGEVDAGLYGAPSVDGYRTIQTFTPIPYYFAFRRNDAALKSEVDDAMGRILSEDPLYFDKLAQKYTSSITYGMEALTAEEKTYIAAHPDIVVAVLEDDKPYYAEDRKGEAAGVLPDFYEKLSQDTGLRFTFRAYKTQLDAVNAVRNGQASVLGMYSDGQIPAYNSGLRLSRAYANVDTVLVTPSRVGARNVKTVAVRSRCMDAVKTAISERMDATLVGYNTAAECFDAVKRGKADAMICGLPSATWIINQNSTSAYSILTLTSGSLELCAATVYSDTVLCSILSKAISASSYSFNETVTNNTLPEDNWESMIARIPPVRITIIGAALLALVLCLIWTLLSLTRRQKERAAVMAQAAQTERERVRLEAIEKSAEEKNQFFSNISHDMRTPLNAIIGFTSLAKKPGLPEAQRSDYLDKIQSSGELLLELINDTLTISKANSGKLELHPVPMDTEEIGWSISNPIRTVAEQKGIAFSMDKSGYRPRVILADQLNLQKIFLNLLNNAVKYTPSGGHVWVTVRDDPAGAADPDIVISVRDDGIGISEAFLPHLFEPFAQEKRTGYESTGTGLGLSIVRQLVDLMGGTIGVESEKGRGTTFTVRLHFAEVSPDELPVRAAKPASAHAELSGRKLLLCEDNALNREIACELLHSRNMNAVTAENGQLGVELFSKSAPGEFAAILMDIRMPVMDGLEATAAIRALPRPDAQTIPIVAMTADAFDDDIRKCLAAGMNAHIAKPVDPEQLFDTLSAVLSSDSETPS